MEEGEEGEGLQRRDDIEMKSSGLRDGDVEGTAGDVLVAPFDDEDVAALFFDCIRDVVHPVAHVFDVDLLAGRLWPVNAHHQHVGACRHRSQFLFPGWTTTHSCCVVTHLLCCSPL